MKQQANPAMIAVAAVVAVLLIAALGWKFLGPGSKDSGSYDVNDPHRAPGSAGGLHPAMTVPGSSGGHSSYPNYPNGSSGANVPGSSGSTNVPGSSGG